MLEEESLHPSSPDSRPCAAKCSAKGFVESGKVAEAGVERTAIREAKE